MIVLLINFKDILVVNEGCVYATQNTVIRC